MAAITTVYFATNRQPDPTKPGGFGSEIVSPDDPSQVLYAVAEVDGIVLNQENSGILRPITGQARGGFAATVRAEILARQKNLLVFIHGFDNSFEDAIKRAAFNHEWFAASGEGAADTSVLAFTWPSAGTLILDLPRPPQTAYLADQAMAARSCVHLADFLGKALALAAEMKSNRPDGRAFLLAHSMGNHALSCAVRSLFTGGFAASEPFDEAILAAADEVNTTLETPDQSGMYHLRSLARRISIYSSMRDIAMDLSLGVNHNQRLGFDGQASKQDQRLYPANSPPRFRSIDCTHVFDFFGLVPPDATHQYYRRSVCVRQDIARLMANGPVASGVCALRALPS